ncbi:MAG TPA: hypothetical protein VKM94_14260, partial [Blastocatellia bacterium]|nr:hypothetical protein [Blastocatellia bacterium]
IVGHTMAALVPAGPAFNLVAVADVDLTADGWLNLPRAAAEGVVEIATPKHAPNRMQMMIGWWFIFLMRSCSLDSNKWPAAMRRDLRVFRCRPAPSSVV